MENIIFAALLYILVPAFLLWLNHESTTANLFVDPQSKNNIRTEKLPHQHSDYRCPNKYRLSSHQSVTSRKINPTTSESNLLNHKCAQAQSHHTNAIQKAPYKQVLPTIIKLESKDSEQDYHQLTIRQLKKIAQKRKIKRYGSMRKEDLILALTT